MKYFEISSRLSCFDVHRHNWYLITCRLWKCFKIADCEDIKNRKGGVFDNKKESFTFLTTEWTTWQLKGAATNQSCQRNAYLIFKPFQFCPISSSKSSDRFFWKFSVQKLESFCFEIVLKFLLPRLLLFFCHHQSNSNVFVSFSWSDRSVGAVIPDHGVLYIRTYGVI